MNIVIYSFPALAPASQQQRPQELTTMTKTTEDYFSRFENDGRKILVEMAGLLNVALALPCALKIYNNALTRYSEIFRRKDTVLMCASCLMFSIKRLILPISRKQMIKTFGLREKLFNRVYNSMSSMCTKPATKTMGRVFSGEKFIDEWAGALELPEGVKQHAKQVIRRVEIAGTLGSRLPNTIAASVIYKICVMNNCKKSYEEMAYLASIDPSTVRSAVNLLGGIDMSYVATPTGTSHPTSTSTLSPTTEIAEVAESKEEAII